MYLQGIKINDFDLRYIKNIVQEIVRTPGYEIISVKYIDKIYLIKKFLITI